MKKHILLIAFTFLSYSAMTQNKAIEKIWQLENVYGDVSVFTAVTELVRSPDVFKLDSNGEVLVIPERLVCGNETAVSSQTDKPEIIGRWYWDNNSIIRIESSIRGHLIQKKYKVSKLTDTQLILIEIKQ